jgi:hypothetical protein
MKLRQLLMSMSGLALVFAILAAVDERVRDEFNRLLWGSDGISSWDSRLVGFGDAIGAALKYQSLENGTLMVFAAVAGVLFLFMVRS